MLLSFCHIFNRSKDMGENVLKQRIFRLFRLFLAFKRNFSRQPYRVTIHFKAYQILNVVYGFLFVISSIVQKIWTTKTHVNSAFFGFFIYFRPLNVIFRDSPTELPLILKLIKFQMQHMASFLSYLQSFRRYGQRQILSFKNAISFL